MKMISMPAVLTLSLFLLLGTSESGADTGLYRGGPDRALFGKSLNKKKVKKVKEPGKVTKAKKKQEAKQKQLKKDYADSVKASRQRSYEIQSPEVKERMKQNEKDIVLREKAKKKRVYSNSKNASKKYR
jgi:hypothetical protein